MKHLLHRLQASLAARDIAVEQVKESEQNLPAARAALDSELRARNDSDDIIKTMTEEARQVHIERAEQAIADALATERDPFANCADYGGAVIGHTDAPPRD
jgi:membrane carboxypeptidase/penicillin-binding protein PbpC